MPVTKGMPSLYESEHIGPDETGDNINAKRSANYVWDGGNWQRMVQPSGGGTVTNDGSFAKESGGNLDTLVANQTNSNQKTQITNFPATQPISGSVTANTNLIPVGTSLNTYSVRITTSTTTTPISSTCYISSITIVTTAGQAATTLTIQDKSGTPLILVDGLATTSTLVGTPPVLNFQTPIKMTGGIDIVTAGVTPASNNVWINFYA